MHGRDWKPVALLLALACTAAPFLGGGWSTDDFSHIGRLLERPSLLDLFRSPDPFGFYRPVAHATLLLDSYLWGFHPVLFRLTNLGFHLLVVWLGYGIARRLLTPRAAFLATLAFVLTPKAHTIAIFWASARPEFLMAIFSLISVRCWMEWERRQGLSWLALTAVAYVLAVLSKETAALLPLVLLATPTPGPIATRRRVLAAGLILCLIAVPIGLRQSAGALMPLSSDQHYGWSISMYRWLRGIEIYVPRALPSAAALLVVVSAAAVVTRSRAAFAAAWERSDWSWLIYGSVWFLVFIAPVLPVVARSELYLYLPGFGFCLGAGRIADRLMARLADRRAAVAAVTVLVVGLAGYQVARAVRAHRVFRFSAALVQAITDDRGLAAYHGHLLLIPTDASTEQLLRDGVGGYLTVVLADTLHSTRITGTIAYSDQQAAVPDAMERWCAYDGERVTLTGRAGGR